MSNKISLELNKTAAELLVRLAVEEGVDAQALVMRALGLFEMMMRTKRQGGRLVFVNEHGEESDVVF